jgi:uncharacterized protein YcbK (DUF882 family)
LVQSSWRRLSRLTIAVVLAVTTTLPVVSTPAAGATDERSLYLYYTHTHETARIVFKRNGQYVQSGLRQLNQFLRDWRKNEPANMDPALFDLVWQVYKEVGATQPINIVSAYRSPATNQMLRASSSGVAENSQHTHGKAMDFFIPGVPLDKLRAVGMKYQVGGVGFYPTSGSPFVHMDTGSVRAWPRMTRTQLARVFPDGKTLHLPTDGKPLSDSGRRYAQAEWQQCHQVPCRANDGGGNVLDAIFGTGGSPTVQVASAGPTEQVVDSVPFTPVPMARPSFLVAAVEPPAAQVADLFAPVPLRKSQALQVATADGALQTALDAIAIQAPAPRILMTDSPMVTAYANDYSSRYPEAQRALQMIIDRETTASAPVPRPTPASRRDQPTIQVASLGGSGDNGLDAIGNLFNMAVGAVAHANTPATNALRGASLPPLTPSSVMLPIRERDLVAPDIDHVAETLVEPVLMSSDKFAEIWPHDEADFDPATEMGIVGTPLAFSFAAELGLPHQRFTIVR